MKTDMPYKDNAVLLMQMKSGDKNARQALIENNLNLVRSICLRFRDRGCEMEDLIEIGKIGLLKAIDGFDSSLGYSFSTYAFPLICGEIKRFLRDDGIIRISRTAKKHSALILKTKEDYIKKHGYEPKISQLCDLCNLSAEEVTRGLECACPTISLEEKISSDGKDFTVADTVSDSDSIASFTDLYAMKQELYALPEKERQLIFLRFFKNMTQAETARILGVSQVTVSRNEKAILEKLRKSLI